MASVAVALKDWPIELLIGFFLVIAVVGYGPDYVDSNDNLLTKTVEWFYEHPVISFVVGFISISGIVSYGVFRYFL